MPQTFNPRCFRRPVNWPRPKQRIGQIQDRKDPIDMVVLLNNDRVTANLATRENGSQDLTAAEGQTMADFLNAVVTQAETLAANLTSKADKNAKSLQKAETFINHLLIANTDLPTLKAFAATVNSADAYEIVFSFSGSNSFSVGGTGDNPTEGLQSFIKAPYRMGQKYTISNTMAKEGSGQFSIAVKGGAVTELTYTPAGAETLNLLDPANGLDQQKIATFSRKAQGVITSIDQKVLQGKISSTF